jgi:hypothetical protein
MHKNRFCRETKLPRPINVAPLAIFAIRFSFVRRLRICAMKNPFFSHHLASAGNLR